MVHGKVPAVDVQRGVSHIRNEQQVSSVSGTTPPSDSWDTDFSDGDVDDDISKVSDMNRKRNYVRMPIVINSRRMSYK